MKAQKIDKGYPRRTDAVFGGVPNDAHDVFLYKGMKNVVSFSFYKMRNNNEQISADLRKKFNCSY